MLKLCKFSVVDEWQAGTAAIDTSDLHSDSEVSECPRGGPTHAMTPRFRGGAKPKIGLVVVVPGSVVDDIIGVHYEFIYSPRFRDVVKAEGLTGLKFVPPASVEPYKPGVRHAKTAADLEAKGYMFGHVVGSGGSVAYDPRAKKVRVCKRCGWHIMDVVFRNKPFQIRDWDGSDFFYVDEFWPMLMSERAVAVLSAAKLSGFDAKVTWFRAQAAVGGGRKRG